MKKITTTTVAFAILMFAASAQNNSRFLRHDTVVLNSSECNWKLSKSTNSSVGKSILLSIKQGKLKAIDPFSGKSIPADKIFTWNMPTDTVAVYDGKKEETKYKVVMSEIDPSKISRIKIYQNWYLDATNGKLFSRINFIDLMIELNDPSGLFLGYRSFCRINY